MKFPTKEEFVQIITSIENESKLVDTLNAAFRAIDPENQIMGLESYEKYSTKDVMMRCIFGEAGFNTINWWMYDCISYHMEPKRRAIWYDGSGHPHEIKTAEELYVYIVEYDNE